MVFFYNSGFMVFPENKNTFFIIFAPQIGLGFSLMWQSNIKWHHREKRGTVGAFLCTLAESL
jgi:hypothetical protein